MSNVSPQNGVRVDAQSISIATAAFSALTAVFAAATAFRSYLLAKSIQDDSKSDERVFIGKVSHPDLNVREHSDCVLQIPLFNKSKRKACITDLTVYDSKGKSIPVAWSDEIDNLGNVQNPGHLVGITDAQTVYIRRNDGEEFQYARILLAHSFSQSKQVIIFDPLGDFAKGQA